MRTELRFVERRDRVAAPRHPVDALEVVGRDLYVQRLQVVVELLQWCTVHDSAIVCGSII